MVGEISGATGLRSVTHRLQSGYKLRLLPREWQRALRPSDRAGLSRLKSLDSNPLEGVPRVRYRQSTTVQLFVHEQLHEDNAGDKPADVRPHRDAT